MSVLVSMAVGHLRRLSGLEYWNPKLDHYALGTVTGLTMRAGLADQRIPFLELDHNEILTNLNLYTRWRSIRDELWRVPRRRPGVSPS